MLVILLQVLLWSKNMHKVAVILFSHALNAAERNYPTHERELLAILIGLRTWRQ
jgi:hypothetical protein